MKHRYVLTTLVLILACASIGKASDRSTAETQLRQELENKVLSLRVPSASEKLQFNSDGQLVGTSLPAPWTTVGLLKLKKVFLKRNSVQIDCERVLLALRAAKPSSDPPTLAPVLTGRSVRLTLDLASNSPDVDHIKAILAKIFEAVDVQQRIAAYWKPAPKIGPDAPSSEKMEIAGMLEGARPVYRVRPGVVEPPQALHAPDPGYTAAARNKQIQGTAVLFVIINEKGLPEVLEVVKDLGEGLDIEALVAVSRWRFKPAIRDGKPVAVMINVEVTFRLS